MRSQSRPWWAKIGFSVVAVTVALFMSLFLSQYLSYGRLIGFLAAVIFSALYGGFISGIVTTVLSLLLMHYFLLIASIALVFGVNEGLVFIVFTVMGTAISWMEDQRQISSASYTESIKRFELVTESLYGLIFDYDLVTGKRFRSDGVFELIGYKADEIPSTPDWWQEQVHPDDLAQSITTFAAAVASQTPLFQCEYRMRHKDGHYVWVWDNSRILYNRAGRPIRAVGCTLNIDARKKAGDHIFRLQSVTAALAEAVTLAQVAEVLTTQSVTAVGATAGVVNLFHADTNEIEIIYAIGFHDSLIKRYQRATIYASGASPQAAQTRKPVWFHSRAEYLASFPDLADVPQKQNSEAIAGLPLMYQGRLLGVLGLYFAETRAFHAEEQEFLLTIARQCAVALERAQLYETAQKQRMIAEQTATWLTRLQTVTAALSEAYTSYEVASIIVDSGMAVLEGVNGAVCLLKDNKTFEVLYAAGVDDPQQEATRWRKFLTDPALPAIDAMQNGQPLWFESAEARSAAFPALRPLSEAYPGAWAFLPLNIQGRVIGCAGFIFPYNRPFTEDEKEFMNTLAHYCAQALERTRFYETTKALGAAEERQRLARDLHDAVTQTLFSASLMADTLIPLMDQEPEQAKERIVQLVRLNRASLAEMRTLLLELRPEQVLRTSITDLLNQLTQAVRGRKTIDLVLTIGEVHPMPPDVHVTFYRIAQEALNNMVKHSKAEQVTIFLNSTVKDAEMRITDNGIGFDPQTRKAGLGLTSMRERCDSVGASIEFVSQPGKGTEVVVKWKPEDQPTTDSQFIIS